MANVNVVFVFSQSSQFVPLTGTNASSGFCAPYLAVTDNGGGAVSLSGSLAGSVNIGNSSYAMYPSQGANGVSTTLTVGKNHQPDFTFSVVVPDPNNAPPPAVQKYIPATGYALVGLALKNLGTGGLDLTTFPGLKVEVKGGVTSLEVSDKNSGPQNSSITYDFWVMVQNSSGDVGLIDPLITNQE